MLFAQTESGQLIANMLESLFDAEYKLEERRERLSGSSPDRLSIWPQLCAQGILGTALSEEMGGTGGHMRDISLVQAKVGAALVVEPVLASLTVLKALQMTSESWASDLTEHILSGDKIVVPALQESDDIFAPLQCRVEDIGDGIKLSGHKLCIRHADLANAYVVLAQMDDDRVLVLTEDDDATIIQSPMRLIDGSSAATLEFKNTDVKLIAKGDEACSEILAIILTGLAAEAVGISEKVVASTIDYLKTRSQFGVPLASFQALQHRLADMYIAVEESKAIVELAIDAMDAGQGNEAFRLACAAKSLVDRQARKVGHDAVQLHGGMGVSDELGISHAAKRLAGIRRQIAQAERLDIYVGNVIKGAAA